MKFASLIALALLALAPPSTGRAENSVTAISSLDVQIWPDYDRPAVLVMMSRRTIGVRPGTPKAIPGPPGRNGPLR